MAPLIFLLLFLGPVWGFTAFIFGAVALSANEFFRMSHPGDRVARASAWCLTLGLSAGPLLVRRRPPGALTLLAVLPIASLLLALARLGDVRTAGSRMAATAFGPLWSGIADAARASQARREGAEGPGYVLMTLMFAWLADTGGYFAGRFFGEHKLYEAVSPKKTVEGLVGALGGAMTGGRLAHFWYLPRIPLLDALALALVGGVLRPAGRSRRIAAQALDRGERLGRNRPWSWRHARPPGCPLRDERRGLLVYSLAVVLDL